MSSDLLVRLARLQRETRLEHDPRWDALASGALPPGDAEALHAEAARRGRPDLVDAFAPLDAAAHERLTQHTSWLLRVTSGGLSRAKTGSRSPAKSDSRSPATSVDLSRATSVDLSRTTPRPISRVRRVANRWEAQRPSRGAFIGALAVAFCAAAAAIALFIRVRPDPVEIVTTAARSVAALPAYLVEASGGDAAAAVRSGSDDVPLDDARGEPPARAVSTSTLGAGTPFSLLLRPETPVTGPVDVRACAARVGRIHPWSPDWERSEQGSFRVEGTRESLFPEEPPGELTLLFAIAPPGELPTCDALAARTPGGIVLLRHRVVLR